MEQGEQYEGIREQKRLVFGEVGEEHVEQDIDTYILIAPQVRKRYTLLFGLGLALW